jgi:hypothetical protein
MVCGVTISEVRTNTDAGCPGIVTENDRAALVKPFK